MKKGFTLIELLAVIVILAIIALIATPIVINIIDNVKQKSAVISFQNIDKAAGLYFARQQVKNNKKDIVFECIDGICKNDEELLEIKGKLPVQGKILIDKKGNISYQNLRVNGYSCYKEDKNYVCGKERIRDTFIESDIKITTSETSKLLDYKIYGNSVLQNDSYFEIESVGEKTKNIANIDTGLNTQLIKLDENEKTYKLEYTTSSWVGGEISVNLESGKTYTISADILESTANFTGSTGKTLNIYFYSTSSDSTHYQGAFEMPVNGTKTSLTFTSKDDYSSIRLYIYKDKVDIGSYVIFKNFQIEEGDKATEYEPYGKYKIPIKLSNEEEEITTNIILDEPLRKIEEFADYIDFKNQKVVRVIERLEDGSLKQLNISKIENLDLPDILVNKGVNNISINTKINPSKIELEYYK